MTIQLKSREGQVLYELEKSELFPNYRAVLVEAIALGIDLTGLNAVGEEINHVIWKGVNSNSLSFEKCSMKKNEFSESGIEWLGIRFSDLTGSKFLNCEIQGLHISDCNLSQTSIRNSSWHNSFLIGCEFQNASFYNCDLFYIGFHTTNLSEAVFNKCGLDNSSFVHPQPDSDWMKNTYFISCSFKECSMEYLKDISQLFIWNSDPREIFFNFEKTERFTKIENEKSMIIYAIDSDVVWWKPYSWKDNEKGIFRGNLKDFTEEVCKEFPTTDLYPLAADFEIEEELLHVCKYLESWKNGDTFSE